MSDPDDEYDDSDLTVPPALTGDVRQAALLLEWARRRGFALPHIEIGSVRMRADDLNPRYGRHEGDPDEPGDIYEEHGLARGER